MWLNFIEYCRHRDAINEMAQAKDVGKFSVPLDEKDKDFIDQAVAQGISPVSALRTRYTLLLSDKPQVGEKGPVRFFSSGRVPFKTVTIDRTHVGHLRKKLRDLGLNHAAENGFHPHEEMDPANAQQYYNVAFGRANAGDIIKRNTPTWGAKDIDVNYGRATGRMIGGSKPGKAKKSDSLTTEPKTGEGSLLPGTGAPMGGEETKAAGPAATSHDPLAGHTTKPVPNNWSSTHLKTIFSDKSKEKEAVGLLDMNPHPDLKGSYDFSDVWRAVGTLVGDVASPGKHIYPEVWKAFHDSLPQSGHSIFSGVRRTLKMFEPSALQNPIQVKEAMMQATATLLSKLPLEHKKNKSGHTINDLSSLLSNSKELANLVAGLTRDTYVRQDITKDTSNTRRREIGTMMGGEHELDRMGGEHEDIGSDEEIMSKMQDLQPAIDKIEAKLGTNGWDVDKLSQHERDAWDEYQELERAYKEKTSEKLSKREVDPAASTRRRGTIHPQQARLDQVRAEIRDLEPQAKEIEKKLEAGNWLASAVSEDEWDLFQHYEKLEKELRRLEAMTRQDTDDLDKNRYASLKDRVRHSLAHESTGPVLGFNDWCTRRTGEGLSESWQPVRFPQSGYKPHQTIIGNVKLKLFRDADTREFCVRWIENNRTNEEKSYYTNDMTDALQTMSRMAQEILRQQGGPEQGNSQV